VPVCGGGPISAIRVAYDRPAEKVAGVSIPFALVRRIPGKTEEEL